MPYLFATCLRPGQYDSSALARGLRARSERACDPIFARATEGALRPWPRSCELLAVSLMLWLTPHSARAEADTRTLTVLRATAVGVDRADCAALDAVLDDALAQLPTFSSVDALPVPLEDVQLAAGCLSDLGAPDETRAALEIACLRLVARQLDVDTLLVRQLSGQGDGTVLLTMLVQDLTPTYGEPQRAQAVLPHASAKDSKRSVQQLVTQLFPQAKSRASSSAEARRRRALGWTLSAVGTGLLVASLTCATLARHDERSYADVDIENEQDVDHAQQLLGRAERRARMANVFLGTGVAVTAAGVASLLWPFAVLRKDSSTAALSIQPTNSGAMLMVDGAWRGGK